MLKHIKDFFIPHKGNGYRPNLLERFSMGVMLVLILLSFAMANLQALLWIGSDWLVSTILPAVIVDLTNDERGTESLVPLTRSTTLDEAATMKAADMAKNSYFAHYSPSGVSPWYWFDEAGYDYLHAGENLAVHFTESDEVVEAWMNSPSHRANIMNGEYLEIGVGTAKGEYKGRPTIFVVQLFGAPRKPVVPSAVAGARTTDEQTQISVEKIAVTEEGSADVAPASIEIGETEVVSVVEEMPAPAPLDSVETAQVVLESAPTPVEVVYTSLATTSREGELAIPAVIQNNTQDSVSLPIRTTTEASLWLETVYTVLALTVLFALTVSVAYEWRAHHPVQIAYAGGLFAVMALLMYIHVTLTGQVLIV